MPEHQKVQKRTHKNTEPPGRKEKFAERELGSKKKEMRKITEEIEWKEERFTQLADKVDKNRMADAEMEAELQGLQAGEERRGSIASQAVDCCLETMVEQIFTMGTDQARFTFDALCKIFFTRFETTTPPAQMPGREEGRRDSENEQEQGRASQQLVLPTPGGVNQDAPASSLELDLLRVRGVLGESGSAGRASEQGDRLLWMKKTMTMWEDRCLKPKRKEKSQGRDPREPLKKTVMEGTPVAKKKWPR